VRALESDYIAQIIHQQEPWLYLMPITLPIDLDFDMHLTSSDYSEGNVRQCIIEGRAWKSEGIETISFNAMLGAWLDVRLSPKRLLHK
jgi:hypothetical protein